MSNAEYIATKDVAKLIRTDLAEHFPGIAFSVRTHTYSGGSHVNVHWQDGPSPRQVDAKIGHFCGRTFDGMDDSTHHHNTKYQGRVVHFGGSQPSTQRNVSDFDGRTRLAEAMIRERCRLEPEGWFGNDRVEDLARGMVWAADYREPNPLERAFRIVVMREREEEVA